MFVFDFGGKKGKRFLALDQIVELHWRKAAQLNLYFPERWRASVSFQSESHHLRLKLDYYKNTSTFGVKKSESVKVKLVLFTPLCLRLDELSDQPLTSLSLTFCLCVSVLKPSWNKGLCHRLPGRSAPGVVRPILFLLIDHRPANTTIQHVNRTFKKRKRKNRWKKTNKKLEKIFKLFVIYRHWSVRGSIHFGISRPKL